MFEVGYLGNIYKLKQGYYETDLYNGWIIGVGLPKLWAGTSFFKNSRSRSNLREFREFGTERIERACHQH
jgi:hypothetical protein